MLKKLIKKLKKMKIEKKSTIMTVDKKTNQLRTNIPALIRDILSLRAGDTIIWRIEQEELKIRKEEK